METPPLPSDVLFPIQTADLSNVRKVSTDAEKASRATSVSKEGNAVDVSDAAVSDAQKKEDDGSLDSPPSDATDTFGDEESASDATPSPGLSDVPLVGQAMDVVEKGIEGVGEVADEILPGEASGFGGGEGEEGTVFQSAEPEFMIYEVHLVRKYVVTDAMEGFLTRGAVQVPLGALMNLLNLPIQVDPDAGRASGWFLSENRLFSLDAKKGEVVIEGKKSKFDKSRVLLEPDDIYVDTTLLSKWFPIDINFNLANLVINLEPRELLPFQEKLEREKKRERIGSGGPRNLNLPKKRNPYRLFELPFVSSTYNLNFDSESTEETVSGTHSQVAVGDLLYHTTTLRFAGDDQDPLTSARLLMGRQDPYSKMFGPLKISEYSFGDIFTPQTPLVSGSTVGAGFVMSSFPFNTQGEFDRINLRGELQDGWEVELYRNEVLIASQTSRADGRYEFLDVQLLFGANVLRLVFYGPQAQRKEETQTILVGQGQISPGKQFFRVGANFNEVDTIPIDDLILNEDDTDDPLEGELRFSAEYLRGISQKWSLALSVASLPLPDGEDGEDVKRVNYVTGGWRTTLFGAFSRADLAVSDEGGASLQVVTNTNYKGINILLQSGYSFNEFESERITFDEDDPLLSQNQARLDWVVPEWRFIPRIPMSFNANLDRRESGEMDIDLSNRMSIFIGGISITNNLFWAQTVDSQEDPPPDNTLDGSLLLNWRRNRLSVRGSLSYDLKPVTEFLDVDLQADYAISNNLSGRAGVFKSLTEDGRTRLSFGLNQRFKKVALGATGSWSDDNSVTLGLSASMSFALEPRRKKLTVTSNSLTGSGAASARVFLDKNQNNRYDRGDEPLENVMFSPRGSRTDKRGIAFIPNLIGVSQVQIQEGTLEDPFWTATRKGYEVVARPGKTTLMEFPVVQTGEIEGMVFFKRVGLEASNVELQLVDKKGEVAQETKSEFDGFFLFQKVIPGKYILRVKPEQVESLKLQKPPVQKLVLRENEDLLRAEDYILKRIGDDDSEDEEGGKGESAPGDASGFPDSGDTADGDFGFGEDPAGATADAFPDAGSGTETGTETPGPADFESPSGASPSKPDEHKGLGSGMDLPPVPKGAPPVPLPPAVPDVPSAPPAPELDTKPDAEAPTIAASNTKVKKVKKKRKRRLKKHPVLKRGRLFGWLKTRKR